MLKILQSNPKVQVPIQLIGVALKAQQNPLVRRDLDTPNVTCIFIYFAKLPPCFVMSKNLSESLLS